MYAVVGCRECQHLWIVADRPDTTSCPRCGHRRAFEKFRQFVTTEDEDHAREVRSSMLASRRDESEAFADLDSFAELDERVDDAVIDDEPLLERSGVDPDAVAAAGDR
ncbi:replication protein H, partial [Halobacteriales archaeon SW_7_68_16]